VKAKLTLIALLLVTSFLWLFAGVAGAADKNQAAASGTTSLIFFMAIAFTGVAIWRICVLRLDHQPTI
jgi:hypothetical protein